MFEALLIVTGIIIAGSAFYAYQTSQDPLHPMLIFAPMMLYVYVYHPYTLDYQGGLALMFRRPDQLSLVLLVHLVGVIGFCIGAVSLKLPRLSEDRRLRVLDSDVGGGVRKNIVVLAVAIGLVAMVAFWFMVWYSGGPMRLMAKGKPFLKTPTGYIGEMPMLTYPSLLLLAVGWQGLRLTMRRGLGALFIASPQIAWVIIGKRRGPLFLITVCLAAFYFLVTGKKPSWRSVMLGIMLLGVMMLFLLTNRRHLGMTSEGEVDFSAVTEIALGSKISNGDDYVAGAGYILACEHNSHHFWGVRLFQTFFIRPIPRQLWPTKYADFGLEDLVKRPGMAGMSTSQWIDAVGWEPTKGSAGGFIADAFIEFSWGCLVMCGLIGWMYAHVWRKSIAVGGVWSVIYAELLLLSIYLPTQSIGAWMYRLLLLVVPSLIIWKLVVKRTQRRVYSPQFSGVPTSGGLPPASRRRRPLRISRHDSEVNATEAAETPTVGGGVPQISLSHSDDAELNAVDDAIEEVVEPIAPVVPPSLINPRRRPRIQPG